MSKLKPLACVCNVLCTNRVYSSTGRPIVKGSGFSGNPQQQPQYFPQEIGRMPQQPNMMGMQRMPGGHKIGPQNPMQQQQPSMYMNQQQNMFTQQNRGEFSFLFNYKLILTRSPCFRHANRKQWQHHHAATAPVRPTFHQLDQSGPAAAT